MLKNLRFRGQVKQLLDAQRQPFPARIVCETGGLPYLEPAVWTTQDGPDCVQRRQSRRTDDGTNHLRDAPRRGARSPSVDSEFN